MKRVHLLFGAGWRVAALAAICSLSAACRDGVTPFVPVPIDADTGSFRRLTRSPLPDVNPTWNATSDTVYYTVRGFVDFPDLAHTMLRLSIDSGPATRIAPDAQTQNALSVLLPVLSPDRTSFAYVTLPPLMPPAACVPPPPGISCTNNEPLLVPGAVRVRPVGAKASATADPGVNLPLQGADPRRGSSELLLTQRLYPFQAQYNEISDLQFRPTWAPDSRRIAFSDGLMLHLWNTTNTFATPIPNTTDGVSPAWHPSGDQIAFAKIIRGDSTRINCLCYEGATPPKQDIPVHQRWLYTIARKVVVLINADGTGLTELTEGEEPAWSPDGNTLYFVRDHQIYSIARSGGAPVLLAGTLGARAPSVSPDGKWIAFARPTFDDTDPDIWILRLGTQ